jgi:succinate dehydrogenase assembly factor 1
LKKKDVGAIEYYLRRGERMLESYKQDGVTNVSVPEGGEKWPTGWVAKGGKERTR